MTHPFIRLAALVSCLLSANGAEAKRCRPFRLTSTAQLGNPTFDDHGNLVSATVSGTGTATHLGRVTALAQDQFGPPEEGRIRVDGSGSLTAANGDQLALVLDNAFLDLATGQSRGEYIFNGGTGRFTDASGNADFTADPDAANPGVFNITATGTLCY